MVYEAPDLENPSVKKPVAFGVWLLPEIHIQKGPKIDISGNSNQVETKPSPEPLPRRDANSAHLAAFREGFLRAKSTFFDSEYGERQLFMAMSLCHPDYQSRGAGRMLCQWGLDKAKAENLVVTIFASKMGARLYSKLGFRYVFTFRVQVDGEEEYVDIPGIVLEAKDKV